MRYSLFITLILLTLTAIVYGNKIIAPVNGKISRIGVANNHIYLFSSDSASTWKLNINGQIVAQYNKKGEGPKELKSILAFQFLKDGIYIFSSSKCIKTDCNLNFKKEFKIKYPFVELKNNKRVICKISRNKKYFKHRIGILNKQKEMIDITEVLHNKEEGQFTAFIPFLRVKTLNSAHNFVIRKSHSEGLQIYSSDGTLIKEILLKTKPLPVTKKFKELYFESIFRDPRFQGQKQKQEMARKMFYFSEKFPQMHDFYIDRKDDCIYIKTYKREEEKSAFLKYNNQGDFIKTYFLPDAGINIADQSNYTVFYNNTYYYLYENEDGEYVIYHQVLKN